jgi:copper chaperone CopZ
MIDRYFSLSLPGALAILIGASVQDLGVSMAEEQCVVIPVGGMTCDHCAASVTKALSAQSGVSGVRVNLKKGEAAVTGRTLNIPALKAAIEELGFDAGETA